MSEFTQIFLLWTLVFTTVLYSEAEEKQNMFQRGETQTQEETAKAPKYVFCSINNKNFIQTGIAAE